MPVRLRNYWIYSISFAIAWAIVLGIVAAARPERLNTFLLVFAGVAIGWVSGTIAWYVYPPPHKWTGPSTSHG
jgi:ABC-type Fe3+-siderophore transport system permease subunit